MTSDLGRRLIRGFPVTGGGTGAGDGRQSIRHVSDPAVQPTAIPQLPPTSLRKAAIEIIIDGGGDVLSTGVVADLEVPFGATISAVRIFADQSGSVVLDIWKDIYDNFPPTSADSIIGTGGTKPTLSSATKYQDEILTAWKTGLNAGDILRFNVDSATTITRVTLSLSLATVEVFAGGGVTPDRTTFPEFGGLPQGPGGPL